MAGNPFESPNQINIVFPICVPTAAEAEGCYDFKINRCNEAFREPDVLRTG